MEINNAAASFLAAACITAGAGGAYLITRPDPTPATEAATSVSPAPPAAPVEQSEALVSDAPPPAGAPDAAAVERRAPGPRRVAPPAAPAPRRQSRPSSATARGTRPAETPDDYVAPSPEARPAIEPRVATPPTLAPSLLEPEPIAAGPQFEELVLSSDSVIGLEVESSITSERARVEDEVVARVTRDVRVGDRVAIPSGSRAVGEVTLVERGGKMRDKARLGVRFTSLVLADGTRVPIDTDTIIREGSSPGGESAAKMGGGALGGAILGGILGGAKGAIIGGAAGAGAGTAAVMAGGRNPATLPAGAPITVRLMKPATVTVEK